jgi:hypothetical protein
MFAALCAATTNAYSAGVHVFETTDQTAPVVLRAVFEIGTISSCGMREAPHLIEHMLLSHTRFGETPVDAILALRAAGIKLTATTHSDFTEIALEGSRERSGLMSEAMATFLNRPALPIEALEREKKTIINELHTDDNYRSSPTFYERFIALNAEGQAPCKADTRKFMDYDYTAVQGIYQRLYSLDKLHIVAQAPAHTFELANIAQSLLVQSAADVSRSQDTEREANASLDVDGLPGQVEIIVPIAGRRDLSKDAADELNDQIRLNVQAYLRSTYQLYTVRSFIDQSLAGGWIRIEAPQAPRASVTQLIAIVERAMKTTDLAGYRSDPIWQALGSRGMVNQSMPPVVATSKESAGILGRALETVSKAMKSFSD